MTTVPVSSLGADVSNNVRQKASQGRGRVVSIHLDEIQNIIDAKRIITSVEALLMNTKKRAYCLLLRMRWWINRIGKDLLPAW